MTKEIMKKLESNRGASMILALVLFLVCVMVSSVIIAAASTGASRNAKRVEQQMGYLAVSSASDLIVEELDNIGTYAGKNIKGRYGCQDCNVEGYIEYNGELIHGFRLDAEYTTNPVDEDYESNPLDDGHMLIKDGEHLPYVYTKIDEQQSSLGGMLGNLFKRACDQVFVSGTDYEEVMTIALKDKDSRLPDVTCKFVMNQKYDASFVLTTEVSEYSVIISTKAKEENVPLPDSIDVTDVHTIYYKDFDENSGTYSTVKQEWAIPIEVSTVIKTISWDAPTIEKGGLSQ